MDRELEKYHLANAAMDKLIGELRVKLDAMQASGSLQRSAVKQAAATVVQFKRDISACVEHIQVSQPRLLLLPPTLLFFYLREILKISDRFSFDPIKVRILEDFGFEVEGFFSHHFFFA